MVRSLPTLLLALWLATVAPAAQATQMGMEVGQSHVALWYTQPDLEQDDLAHFHVDLLSRRHMTNRPVTVRWTSRSSDWDYRTWSKKRMLLDVVAWRQGFVALTQVGQSYELGFIDPSRRQFIPVEVPADSAYMALCVDPELGDVVVLDHGHLTWFPTLEPTDGHLRVPEPRCRLGERIAASPHTLLEPFPGVGILAADPTGLYVVVSPDVPPDGPPRAPRDRSVVGGGSG